MAIDTPPWAALLPRAPDPAQPQTPNQMLLLQANQLKLDEARRQQQGNNTIAQMFQNPANLQNGFPKQDAIAQAIGSGALPPSMGMELIGNEAKVNADQQRQAQAQIKQQQERAEAERKWQQDMIEAFAPANTAYNDTLKKTGSEQAAQAAAQAMRDEIFNGLKQNGTQTPEHIRMLEQNRQYNHQIASTNLLGAKGLADRDDKEVAQRSQATRDFLATQAADRSGTTDPKTFSVQGPDGTKTPQLLYFNKDTKAYQNLKGETVDPDKVTEASAKDASQDEVDALAEDIYGLRKAPLSGQARGGVGPRVELALKRIGQEQGKPYDARDYSASKRLLDGYASTAANSAGGQMNATNTAVQHVEQLRKLAVALQNNDIPAANAVRNYVQTALGKPEPGNVKTAAMIVGDELVKAVIGAGGAVSDREKILERLSNTQSPDQMAGALDTLTGLLGGSVNSRRRQYLSVTKRSEDEFEQMLSPEALDALSQYLKKEERRGGKKADAAKEDAATPAKPGDAAAAPVAPPPPITHDGKPLPPTDGTRRYYDGGWKEFRGGKWYPAPDGGTSPQQADGVPTYSDPAEFKKNPPTGYWRKPDDPPGMVRPPP